MSRKNRLRKKKAKQARQASRQSLVPTELPENVLLVESPPGEKMSEVLLDFIEPYVDEPADDVDNLRKVLVVAIVAWNAAIVPHAEGEKLIEICLDAMPETMHAEARAWLDELIRRKQQYFADNRRLIINYTVTMRPDGPFVQVMSTLSDVSFGRSLLGTAGQAMIAFGRWIGRGVRKMSGG
jgi:hypothetical protein